MPEFHDAFTMALGGDAGALRRNWSAGPGLEAGLTVYRNTMAKGCADALVAQFPTVLKLVGEPWLGAAAVLYAQAHPPRQASLLTYGEDFPTWLATFAPAADLPHLAGLAGLDLLWTEAHLAADAAPLAPTALQALAPADFFSLRAELHPATRFARFDATIPSLWRALQADAPLAAFEIEDDPEGLLLVRPGLDIDHRVIGPGVLALLDACLVGHSLGEAAGEALAAQPDLALDHAFADLIELGCFARLTPTEPA